MSATGTAARATTAEPAAGVVRTVTRGLGELLITAGLVLLLFVAYQLVWTNLEADRAQGQVADQIREQWQRPPVATGGTGEDGTGDGQAKGDGGTSRARAGASKLGEGLAFLHIPRLGTDFAVPVLEGVTLDVLARGVGHYPDTALPGQVGNFAVAGHRATNGEPFAALDLVQVGDALLVETRRHWLRYVVDSTRIVQPTDTWVIDPVPGQRDAVPRDRLITLTTCNPRWASYQRLIVFGHLETKRPKSDGPPPELARA